MRQLVVAAVVGSVCFGGCGRGDAGDVGDSAATVFARPTPRRIPAPDSNLLHAAALHGDSLPKLRALVVAWRGDIAVER